MATSSFDKTFVETKPEVIERLLRLHDNPREITVKKIKLEHDMDKQIKKVLLKLSRYQ